MRYTSSELRSGQFVRLRLFMRRMLCFTSFDLLVFLCTVPLCAIDFGLFLFRFAVRSMSTLFILFRFGGFLFSLLFRGVSFILVLLAFDLVSCWGKLSI